MIKWEFIFISNYHEQQDIMFVRNYKNGIFENNTICNEKTVFANYIILFPKKDIMRIKLFKENSFRYAFYYIDKKFIDYGFLGILGISEYEENQPFKWQGSESMVSLIFHKYFEKLLYAKLYKKKEFHTFISWMDEAVGAFYDEFAYDKKIYYSESNVKARSKLSKIFSDVKDNQSTVKLYSQKLSNEQWKSYTRKFEIHIISTIGTPLIPVYTFINGERKMWWSDEEEISCNLEDMSISVLNSLVNEKTFFLSLHEIQVKKPENEGYEYILFKNFQIGEFQYLLIINVENYNQKEKFSIPLLKGDEYPLLNRIAEYLTTHDEYYNYMGQIKTKGYRNLIEIFINKECRQLFSN
ncbi:MAG: hypothetical protein ACTSXK_02030 [Promethearchaeota archaeon]